jgi:hypothetical protein
MGSLRSGGALSRRLTWIALIQQVVGIDTLDDPSQQREIHLHSLGSALISTILTSRTASAELPCSPAAAAATATCSRVRATVASANWRVYDEVRSSSTFENVTGPVVGYGKR